MNLKKISCLFILSTVIMIFSLYSCSPKGSGTEFLDSIVSAQQMSESEEKNNSFSSSADENDPLLLALNEKEAYFEGVYTGDGVIWDFHADGTVEAYNQDGQRAVHRYTLLYPEDQSGNKYIELVFADNPNIYRFQKLTQNGFDMVLTDAQGNDVEIFTFLKSSFFKSYLYRMPYFCETFYESNNVWSFDTDGTVTAYTTSGASYTYTYTMEYEGEGDETTRYLNIVENEGRDNEIFIRLRIASYTVESFSAFKLVDGQETDNVITFAK